MSDSNVIELGIQNLTVIEDMGMAIIPVNRTGDTSLAASVEYSINNDTAQSGQDFIGSSGTLNFAPGQTIAEIMVDIIEDDLVETDETFSVAIGQATGAVLGTIRTAIVTIEDDDVAEEDTFVFSAKEYSMGEAKDAATITVVRTGDLNQAVSVEYSTEDYQARAGLDYTAVSGTLTFDPGQMMESFHVPFLDDTLPERFEAVNLSLSNPVGIDLGLQNTARLIIEDNDEVPVTIDRQVIVSGLLSDTISRFPPGPTAFDWSPDGTMFISQLNGIVRVFDGDNLLEEPFIDLSAQVNVGGQRGLLGLAVHPNFSEHPYVYFAFSYDPPDAIPDNSGKGRVTRLVRYTADPNSNYQTALPDSEVILLETPPVRNFHAAGAIHFGHDGELFFAHGDGTQVSSSPTPEQGELLQSIDNPFGKLFRINPITGEGYADNPFYNGDSTSIESKIYSYGLRNPWRFAIHPETGEPVIGDVGWTNWEEINTGKGDNFGWPLYEGGNGVSLRTTALAEDPAFQDLYATISPVTAPIYAFDHNNGEGSAITLGDFYTENLYPSIYQGALFFSTSFNGSNGVDALTFDALGNVDSVLNFADTEKRGVTQIATGPDSHIYFSNLLTGEIGRWVLNDTLIGSDGNDTLIGGTGNDLLRGLNDDDRLAGGDGNDTVIGGTGNDFLLGQDDDDSLGGEDGNDTLIGGNGNDTLIGGPATDFLRGHNDDDRLTGGDGNDTVIGGDGNDTLIGGDGNDTLIGGVGADILKGDNNDDRLIGRSGNDTLNGGLGADILEGGNAHDSLNGGNGNDTLIGGDGNDSLRGHNDDDSLSGGDGNDTLIGGDGADLLRGHNDDDSLAGGDGNDTLIGGLGVDSLRGGVGSDRFVLVSGVTTDQDIILDYEDGVDLLDLTGSLTFGQLTINQDGGNTNILETITNQTLATLIQTDAMTINDSDFR